jgi:hypothetical protein
MHCSCRVFPDSFALVMRGEADKRAEPPITEASGILAPNRSAAVWSAATEMTG